MEIIKQQTRAAYGWLVVGQSVDAGLAYSLQAVVRSLCDMNGIAAAAICMQLVALYKCYMPLPFALLIPQENALGWYTSCPLDAQLHTN